MSKIFGQNFLSFATKEFYVICQNRERELNVSPSPTAPEYRTHTKYLSHKHSQKHFALHTNNSTYTVDADTAFIAYVSVIPNNHLFFIVFLPPSR